MHREGLDEQVFSYDGPHAVEGDATNAERFRNPFGHVSRQVIRRLARDVTQRIEATESVEDRFVQREHFEPPPAFRGEIE